LHE
jgi:TNF receptor-associated protein 1